MSAWREGWAATAEGLRLHYRDHGPARTGATPVVCLPGLTRTCRDFEDLAARLAERRRVICPDMRGRGRSDRADPASYAVHVEAGDVLGLLDGLGIARAAFVGTSRGGLQTMVIAAARPELVAAAVLNDVGPVIEPAGLRAIAGGLLAAPAEHPDWPAAEAALQAAYGASFRNLTAAQWAAFARRLFVERDGRPTRDFDPALVHVTAAAVEQPAPDLWPLFDALAGAPVLAIRGANSDLLGAATLEAMAARLPDVATLTVPDRGHAPFLDEPGVVEAIEALLARADAGAGMAA